MNKVNTIAARMEDTFSGNPWHGGDALLPGLQKVTNYNAQLAHSNTIGQIIEHLLQWKKFGLEKMRGNEAFDIPLNSPLDWNKGKIYSKEEIEVLLKELVEVHLSMMQLLKAQSDDWLAQNVPGKKYNFEFLIEGLIQHDVYHFGQVSILRKGSIKKLL